MTGIAPVQPRTAHPTFDTVDVLAPTLRRIDDRIDHVAGDPGALRAAAREWAASTGTGSRERLVGAGRDVRSGGLEGEVVAAWGECDVRAGAWVEDSERRRLETCRTLLLAADLLDATTAALSRIKLEFVQRGVQAIYRELATPTVDVMLRAARAVVPIAQSALASTDQAVADHVASLVRIQERLQEEAICRDELGAPHHFNVTLGDIVLWPTSWVPDFKLTSWENWWGMVWPEDATRRNLALGTGVMNIVAETKRVSSPYALMTSPTGIFRNILTDTSEPVFGVFENPVANGAAHAAWGAGATYFADFVAGKATARWGEGIGDWLKSRDLFPHGNTFTFETGATKHIAGVNAVTAFALTVKDPLFVEAGLATVDADGRVHPSGLVGEASSLAYDVGVVAGPAAGGLGLERWQAQELSRLTPEERMVHVKRTACADWFVAQGGVLLGRAVDDHYDPLVRAGFAASGLGSVATAAGWCGPGDSGHGGPPAGGVSGPVALLPPPGLSPADTQLLDQWRIWSHDPELSQTYAQSPEYRREALVGTVAGELGLVGAVGAAQAAGPVLGGLGRAAAGAWDSLWWGGAAVVAP